MLGGHQSFLRGLLDSLVFVRHQPPHYGFLRVASNMTASDLFSARWQPSSFNHLLSQVLVSVVVEPVWGRQSKFENKNARSYGWGNSTQWNTPGKKRGCLQSNPLEWVGAYAFGINCVIAKRKSMTLTFEDNDLSAIVKESLLEQRLLYSTKFICENE